MFLSLIPTHLLPSIHLHAGGKALLCVAQALLDLSFFHLVDFNLFSISSFFRLTPFLLPPLFKKKKKKWHLSLVLRCFITLCWLA